MIDAAENRDAIDSGASPWRGDFPILTRPSHGRRLAFLDSAASAQKPETVIEAEADCYRRYYANIHRGVYELSQKSTEAYEGARPVVARFINAPDPREVVYVRGTTEAINLVASSFVEPRLGEGDEILITGMEHHSNIVPWQIIAERTGARLVVSPVTDAGEVDLEDFESRISERTRFASIVHVSNAIGTINPVREMVRAAHARDVPVLVDGAQAAPHMRVDVQALGCDFYCFSAHKVYGPSGVGALWGRMAHLRGMRPYQGGGDMIRRVTFEKTEYAEPPQRFEAGTPNIAGVIAMARALEYVETIGLERIGRHEAGLLAHANEALAGIDGLEILGSPREKAGVISFTLRGAHPHDIGTILDQEGVAVRAGHHCVQPLMERFGLVATVRASLGLYNDRDDVDALVRGLNRVREFFG